MGVLNEKRCKSKNINSVYNGDVSWAKFSTN